MTHTVNTETDHDVPDDYDEIEPSPEELTSTTSNAVVSNDPPTLTVNVEMSRATEYAKEKKSVSSFLKTALPDRAVVENADGTFGLNPAWADAVDQVAKGMLNVLEVAVSRSHGLEVGSDDQGVARVLGLFGGAKASPAAAVAPVAPGPFTAPVVAAAPAVAPAAPVPAVAPAPVVPQVPGAVPQGTFQQAAAVPQVPAPAPQGGGQRGGQRTKSTNPNSWSNVGMAVQQQIAAQLEAWISAGMPQTQGFYDNMSGNYPNLKCGETPVYGNTILGNDMFGPATKAYVQQFVPAGQNRFPSN